MTYVLGAAAATGAPPRLQNTIQGDSWLSLGRAYGITPQEIWALQPELKGQRLNTKVLEAFIHSRPGWTREVGVMKFVSSDNPGMHGGKAGDGWAQFTAATQLMLPDMPRLDGKTPKSPGASAPEPEADIGVSEAGVGIGAILFGVAAIALLALGGKKKKPSPKAVSF